MIGPFFFSAEKEVTPNTTGADSRHVDFKREELPEDKNGGHGDGVARPPIWAGEAPGSAGNNDLKRSALTS